MSCLNKHSAQLEEVWVGGSCCYVHVEVTSYTNWKTRRESLRFFTEGLQTGSLQLSSQPLFRRLCGTGRGSHRRWLFQSYLYSRSVSLQLMERRGERMGRAARSLSLLRGQQDPSMLPSLPPTERNWSLKTPQVFLWPCNTIMFNVLESWEWEHQSLPSCSVECSMSCAAYGRNRCLLL